MCEQDKSIFAVADGFGGPQSGSAAAKQACEATRAFLSREGGDADATLPFVIRHYYSLVGNVLFNAVVHANRELMHSNKNRNVHEKGGASLLAAYLDESMLGIANVGTCGALLVRGNDASELVTPRSYARLVDVTNGKRTDHKNVPLAALGISDDLEPEIVEVKIRGGDWLILFTDGFDAQSVKDAIQSIKQGKFNAEDVPVLLEEWVQKQDKDDNASLLLVIFE